jgi:integrase
VWCEDRRVPSIAAVQPVDVAGYIEELTSARSEPTAKQRLAAIRHLLDWLVVGQVMPANPASSVRGPSHVVKHGRTPMLSPEEARRVLDAIDVSDHAGLRDRALIGLMVYSFARIGAATAMRVEDVFVQDRRLCVRLHEKGDKRHELPCHHNLKSYLHAYIDGTGIAADPKGPLFRTIGRATKQLTRTHPAPGQCARHDPPTRTRRRHQDASWQSHLPGDRDHGVPEKRRRPRKRRRHGQPRLDPHHPALRSSPGRGDLDEVERISI